MHATPTQEPHDDPQPDDECEFHDGDDDIMEPLPGMTGLRIKAAGTEIHATAEGPDGPAIVTDLIALALDAARKLQSSVQ